MTTTSDKTKTTKPWQTIQADDGSVHVRPLDDYEQHSLSSECWCNPRCEMHEVPLFIHDRSKDIPQ